MITKINGHTLVLEMDQSAYIVEGLKSDFLFYSTDNDPDTRDQLAIEHADSLAYSTVGGVVIGEIVRVYRVDELGASWATDENGRIFPAQNIVERLYSNTDMRINS